jgi:hypothetical protein
VFRVSRASTWSVDLVTRCGRISVRVRIMAHHGGS